MICRSRQLFAFEWVEPDTIPLLHQLLNFVGANLFAHGRLKPHLHLTCEIELELVPIFIIGNKPMRTILNFCHGLPEKLFKPNEILLAEGGEDRKLYILIEGEVEVLKGETQVINQTEPGSIFGELTVLLDIPHTASVRAVIPSRTYQVEDAEAFLQSNPDLAFQLAKLLAKRLNSITTYLVDLKNQFEDQQDHLGLVDEVLETLLNQQVEKHSPGSERYPDTSLSQSGSFSSEATGRIKT